jgi:histidine ammonia-lyase
LNEYILDQNKIDLIEIDRIISGNLKIVLSEETRLKLVRSRSVVEEIINDGRSVYGINTGFGKFSEHRISNEQIEELQRRIVLSHSCGVGEPIPLGITKMMMLLKLKSLSLGYSGVSLETFDFLMMMFNRNILPLIPQKGSVGASGDLAPLAHMALPIIGEGKCFYENQVYETVDLFKKLKIKPISLKAKDGLAILNGTQAMAAYLTQSLLELKELLNQADIIAAMSLEALTGTSRAFDSKVQDVRGQIGQHTVAKHIRKMIEGSELVNSRNQVQDAYSLRCVPQVHGSIRDTYDHCLKVLEHEVNGVTDNPIVFIDENDVISGGNFHGQPLAFIADFMAIATAELGSISERRIAHLVDPNHSHLPAFLVNEGGLNSGFMIPQYTAASLVSENKVLASPASIDSIPTSANKEDHVSMGTHASRKLLSIIENVRYVLGIELLSACQGIELIGADKSSDLNKKVFNKVREIIPFWDEDRLMNVDLESINEFLKTEKLSNFLNE